MKKKSPVKSWSLSALQMYESCPACYKANRIDKIKGGPASPAMERGIAIHAKGEHYLTGDIPNVPKEYDDFKVELRNLRNHGALPEKQAAFTKDWKPTGWTSRDAWLRLVVDAEVETEDSLLLIDFKTGRIYADKHEDQANLYATSYLQQDVHEEIDVEFWYLDQNGTVKDYRYLKDSTSMYREYWEDRVAPLFAETKWPTTPSKFACRYCVIKDTCQDVET